MKGAGTDDRVLIEELSSSSNKHIAETKVAYHAMYQRDLEKDLASETSGHFKRMLVSLVQVGR